MVKILQVEDNMQHKRHSVLGVVLVVALALGAAWFVLSKKDAEQNNFAVQSVYAMNESKPIKLEVPSIGIDAQVVELGLNPDMTVEIPKRGEEVGWYKHSQTPGEIGPSVLIGHLDWNGGKGVFYDLNKLETGNTFRVTREDGSVAVFVVEDKEEYSQFDFPTDKVYGKLAKPGIRLVTCSGKFLGDADRYSHNLVIYASLIQGK